MIQWRLIIKASLHSSWLFSAKSDLGADSLALKSLLPSHCHTNLSSLDMPLWGPFCWPAPLKWWSLESSQSQPVFPRNLWSSTPAPPTLLKGHCSLHHHVLSRRQTNPFLLISPPKAAASPVCQGHHIYSSFQDRQNLPFMTCLPLIQVSNPADNSNSAF